MELRFDRSLDVPYGEEIRLSPRVSRVLAPNPGPFTFKGTGVYLVGSDPNKPVAVIDPGPAIPDHIAALARILGRRGVSHILLTHSHRDHSPAAAALKAWSGARTYGCPLRPSHLSGATGTSPAERSAGGGGGPVLADEGVADEALDRDFVPDVAVADGEVIAGDGFNLRCVATPGHTSNHMCYALEEEAALFSGDHVMGWATSVVAPPDGDMGDYLASLEKLLPRADRIFYPTHGSPITEPQAWVRGLLEHRHRREAQIAEALAAGDDSVTAITTRLYPDVTEGLRLAAASQVRAHLDRLVAQGKAVRDGACFRP